MSAIQDLIAQSANDTAVRAKLKQNPLQALQDAGVAVPTGATAEVIETKVAEMHLNLGGTGRPAEIQKVLDRAAKDKAFQKQLLESPKPTLESALGQTLPANVTVRVHEAKPNHVRLFLPPLQSDAEAELSDAELAGVAGGGLLANIRERFCTDYTHTTINSDNWSQTVSTSKNSTSTGGSLMVW